MEIKKKVSDAKERVLLLAKIKSYTKSNDFVKVRFSMTKNLIQIFFKHQLQREIPITGIDAITYSSTSSQFILHVKNDIDERFSSSTHRQEIIEMILYLLTVVGSAVNVKLKFFLIKEKSLALFVTSEEDLEDGHILRPEVKFMSLINYKRFLKMTQGQLTLESGKKNSQFKRVSIEDFELLKVLGKGAHGKVLLCSRKNYPNLKYAMKILKKQHIIDANQLEHTIAEKMILSNGNHPFLVSMKYTFQTESKIYFVMEFMKGGELFQHLKRVGSFTESETKFFCACLVLALGHLHNSNYIYRDLKPENILLDEKGYVKLSDFGLAKEVHVSDLANTFCGTPEYLAPEVIMNKGCNRPADWWSLGILTYEMLFGAPPFYSTDVQEMYKKTILKTLKFPSNSDVSDLAMDFVSGLLIKKSEDRLGSVADSLEVMNHPWFYDLRWSELLAKKVEAPYQPVDNEWETNFDPDFIQEAVRDSKCEINSSLISEYRKKFERFSFEGPFVSTVSEEKEYSSSSLGKIFKNHFENDSPLQHPERVSNGISSHRFMKSMPLVEIKKRKIGTASSQLLEGKTDWQSSKMNRNLNSFPQNTEFKIERSMSQGIDPTLKSFDKLFGQRGESMFEISEEKPNDEFSPKKLLEMANVHSETSLGSSSSTSSINNQTHSSFERAMNL